VGLGLPLVVAVLVLGFVAAVLLSILTSDGGPPADFPEPGTPSLPSLPDAQDLPG
jgi:hypothetical protein